MANTTVEIRLRWWFVPLIRVCCFVLKWTPFLGFNRKMKAAYAVCGWATHRAVYTRSK